MKTREYIDKIQANRWVRTIALGFAAFIVFRILGLTGNDVYGLIPCCKHYVHNVRISYNPNR